MKIKKGSIVKTPFWRGNIVGKVLGRGKLRKNGERVIPVQLGLLEEGQFVPLPRRRWVEESLICHILSEDGVEMARRDLSDPPFEFEK